MKLTRIAVALALSLTANLVVAQNKIAESRDSDVMSRSIRQKFSSREDDGIDFTISKRENGSFVAINPANHTFKKGDEIKVKFRSNFDGFVYLININPKGEKLVFYPDIKAKDTNNTVSAGQVYELPRNDVFVFEEDEQGIEVIQVVMARQPIPFLDDAIRNNGGALGDSADAAAAELKAQAEKPAGVAVENVTRVLPEDKGIQTRKIRLAPPKEKEKDQEGAVVTVSEKLKPGEVAIFEVRLRRV